MKELLAFWLQHREELWHQTLEHLALTLASLSAAILVGGLLGIWLSRRRALGPWVLGAASVIQTVPSLALLAFFIPALGIGAKPAIAALFLYGLLPILRNTLTGIDAVSPAVREAALGMGMTDRQLLMRVDLPLSFPVIFAGIRTAAVINVGMATLCSLIGAGGLGVYIFRGISLNNTTMTIAGALPAALLALTFDATLALLSPRLTRRGLWGVAFAVLLPLAAVAFALFKPTGAVPRFRVGVPPEFVERPDGFRNFAKRYDFHPEIVEMQHGLMYRALAEGRVDAVIGYSTDPEIAALELVPLRDDRHYFPPYEVAPLVRTATLSAHPELEGALNLLAGTLTNTKMAALNARVEREKEPAGSVAREFLEGLGQPVGVTRRPLSADVTIGSKIFAEQYVLAELFAQVIENHTELSVELRTGLGGTQICFEALKTGEIDLYPEYSGTGLLAILAPPPHVYQALLQDRRKLYQYVKIEFQRRFGLTWLKPLGFDNSYALIVRQQDAAAWRVQSVSELARRTRQGRPTGAR